MKKVIRKFVDKNGNQVEEEERIDEKGNKVIVQKFKDANNQDVIVETVVDKNNKKTVTQRVVNKNGVVEETVTDASGKTMKKVWKVNFSIQEVQTDQMTLLQFLQYVGIEQDKINHIILAI